MFFNNWSREYSIQDYRDIKASEIFDEDWYLENYRDVGMLAMDPIEHYLRFGARLNRSPGPSFSGAVYLRMYPDVRKAGANPLLHYIRNGRAEGRRVVPHDGPVRLSASSRIWNGDLSAISFSVIMPTRNRAHCIVDAIDSLIDQTHQNYQFILVDDGSSDGTEHLVKAKYQREFKSGRFVYVRCETPSGVCFARNVGLSKASNDWIVYLDSDNTLRPDFLATFAGSIIEHPSSLTHYANFAVKGSTKVGGRPFDYEKLVVENFIDIGAFCHHRSCYISLGGFDPGLKRLVDWELILRYTKEYPPAYIQRIVMDYNDEQASDRITKAESYALARVQIHRKHRIKDTVSIIVLSYNQEKFIAKALESIAEQKGDFTFEILISDDGSTDKTAEIIQDFCNKHKAHARNISVPHNMGISENFRRCFEAAAGEYIAVLEGDDYWDDTRNLAKKLSFMREHQDCSMVFSKIKMLVEKNGKVEFRTLERQENLVHNKLTGEDFVNDPDMNLIVNFSSCMFRADLIRKLPHYAYYHRLSEITVAFFLEQFGPIGYINEPLSVYRHHGGGTWSGLTSTQKIMDAMKVRKIVKQVARPEFAKDIEDVIRRKYDAHLKRVADAA